MPKSIDVQRKARNLNGLRAFFCVAGDEGFEQEYMLKNTGKINRFLSR